MNDGASVPWVGVPPESNEDESTTVVRILKDHGLRKLSVRSGVFGGSMIELCSFHNASGAFCCTLAVAY